MPPRRAASLTCDVLVLGAGLAGMRAAWAAKEAAPGLRVVLVSPRRQPSGSSFANRNNALGIQAPDDNEADGFVAEALRLAPPGVIIPELTRALAQDAQPRLRDLLDLGLAFRRDACGGLARFPGCFSAAPRAHVFDDLSHAHAAFTVRVRGLGVELLHGLEALDLPRDAASGRVGGAVLFPLRGGEAVPVAARAVIAALGGPAPLFATRLCGPGVGIGGGLAYGLLARAGARLANTRFVQFFWSRAADLGFVNPGLLPWPQELGELAGLAASRRTHCPMAAGLPDRALDQRLLALRRWERGRPVVRAQQAGPLVLAAHAGNGGALIDADGRTTAPGLYACGECAAGMHGADRLGGAMVLSALVFGARAGAAAAREAAGNTAGEPALPDHVELERRKDDSAFLRRLRRGMDRHAPGDAPLPGRERFAAWLRGRAAGRGRGALQAASALAVLEGQPGV